MDIEGLKERKRKMEKLRGGRMPAEREQSGTHTAKGGNNGTD